MTVLFQKYAVICNMQRRKKDEQQAYTERNKPGVTVTNRKRSEK